MACSLYYCYHRHRPVVYLRYPTFGAPILSPIDYGQVALSAAAAVVAAAAAVADGGAEACHEADVVLMWVDPPPSHPILSLRLDVIVVALCSLGVEAPAYAKLCRNYSARVVSPQSPSVVPY